MDFQKELLHEFDSETAKTRKMLEAIPDNADFAWTPHPKSMPLGKLADHVAGIPGDWALYTLTKDTVEWNTADNPPPPANKAEVLAVFDRQVPKARAELVAIAATPEKWDREWQIGANGQIWIKDTRVHVWREMVMNHLVHHRAQLSVYLRLLGAKVPGAFGPSADEM